MNGDWCKAREERQASLGGVTESIDTKMGTLDKDMTCHDWWLRKCTRSAEACTFAHRLFDGRVARRTRLTEPCPDWPAGACMWPASLCYRTHATEADIPTFLGTERLVQARFDDFVLVSAGKVCKRCGVWFAVDEWGAHIAPGPMLCKGL
ncbi:hypothetical protein LTR85_000256 [Meristemomyces frigidus]|nr:hypothetical protein LTR85_000256 [Meristemomyces frigidus]